MNARDQRMGKGVDIELTDAAQTHALGAALAMRLERGDVVFLIGDLGAGKTTLARGVIEALTGETDVPSPTYTIIQMYEKSGMDVCHCDLYRLNAPDETRELGLEDVRETGVLLVEWPERWGALAPNDRLEVRLDRRSWGRAARLTGVGAWEARLSAWAPLDALPGSSQT